MIVANSKICHVAVYEEVIFFKAISYKVKYYDYSKKRCFK